MKRLLRSSAFRYLLVGGLSFLIDFGLLFILFQIAGWPLWLATGTAFLSSFVFNYLLQRAFSFGSNAGHVGTLARYLTLLGFNTIATIGVVSLVEQLGFGWEPGKIIAVILTTLWNFFIFKYWVFAGSQRPDVVPDPQSST